jgi:hypothetical protein
MEENRFGLNLGQVMGANNNHVVGLILAALSPKVQQQHQHGDTRFYVKNTKSSSTIVKWGYNFFLESKGISYIEIHTNLGCQQQDLASKLEIGAILQNMMNP